MWDDAGLEKTEELSSLAAEGWSVRNYYERGFFRDQFSVLANQRAGCGTLHIGVDAWRHFHPRILDITGFPLLNYSQAMIDLLAPSKYTYGFPESRIPKRGRRDVKATAHRRPAPRFDEEKPERPRSSVGTRKAICNPLPLPTLESARRAGGQGALGGGTAPLNEPPYPDSLMEPSPTMPAAKLQTQPADIHSSRGST